MLQVEGLNEMLEVSAGAGTRGSLTRITYDATKMDGAYSDGISSITPLFHQIFMNIRGLFICQTPIETNKFPNTTY